MILQTLLKQFSDRKCSKIYVKRLSPNDNSKNQVYLGGSFDILNILPIKDITSDNSGDWERIRFKSHLKFYWLNEEGGLIAAPDAKLILYPKYPEVRFSGFLKGAKNAPSDLMTNRIDGRLLFLGITITGQILGYVAAPDTPLANEFNSLNDLQQVGVFIEITLQDGIIQLNSREKLLAELARIHSLGWIDAKRLDAHSNILPCVSSNCGGYTLEAELGITPNGNSEPDYLGWEIKQFNVREFQKWESSVVTLMTPEPTHGYYVSEGVEAFIRKYGYHDKMGREARLNFGGVHKYNTQHSSTALKLVIEGIDSSSYKITNTDGYIGLVDTNDNVAASWAFTSLLKHWNTKHANACYVPSKNRKGENLYTLSKLQYQFSDNIILGEGTDFSLVLQQIAKGNIYYDPGIKLELEIPGIRKQFIKRRSQFRIKSSNLKNLYKTNEIINLKKWDLP